MTRGYYSTVTDALCKAEEAEGRLRTHTCLHLQQAPHRAPPSPDSVLRHVLSRGGIGGKRAPILQSCRERGGPHLGNPGLLPSHSPWGLPLTPKRMRMTILPFAFVYRGVWELSYYLPFSAKERLLSSLSFHGSFCSPDTSAEVNVRFRTHKCLNSDQSEQDRGLPVSPGRPILVRARGDVPAPSFRDQG